MNKLIPLLPLLTILLAAGIVSAKEEKPRSEKKDSSKMALEDSHNKLKVNVRKISENKYKLDISKAEPLMREG
jgi:hypothetical protein